MAQTNPSKQAVTSQTISNMETETDSDESVEEVPIPVVKPKPTTTITEVQPKNGGKGRGKRKKATSGPSEDIELIYDVPDNRFNDVVTNKVKIGKSFINSY